MRVQRGSIVVLALAAPVAAQTCNPGWVGLFGGVAAPPPTLVRVAALEVHDDGTGRALYVGGEFRTAGGVTASRVARWDDFVWSGLSGPAANGTDGQVFALRSFDDGSGPALYAGGQFSLAGGVIVNHIARWDGTRWFPLEGATGVGVSGQVVALEVYDDGAGPALYVGGAFLNAGGPSGGVPVNYIARWDGNDWSTLPGAAGFGTNSTVTALKVFDDGSGPALFVGGLFIRAGGVTVNRIAKWDGAEWSPLAGSSGTGVGPSLFGGVQDLAVFDDGSGPALFVAGGFVTAGGIQANRIARWDGSEWSALNDGLSGPVFAIGSVSVGGLGTALYAGGVFTHAGGVTVNRIARWDGSEWSALEGPHGTGITSSSDVAAIAGFNDGKGRALYAGGTFTEAGGLAASRVARWWCASCYPDCNQSGALDIFDFICFQDAFSGADPYADCNGDTRFDIFDFICFQDEFIAGCN